MVSGAGEEAAKQQTEQEKDGCQKRQRGDVVPMLWRCCADGVAVLCRCCGGVVTV